MAYEFAPGSNAPVRLRESIVAAEAPVANELAEGELAVNSTDGTLYCKSGSTVKGFPSASGFTKIVAITQAAYDALATKDSNTLYVIT